MTQAPTLTVRSFDMPNGHRAIALCTEDGEPFGKQLSCSVSSNVDDYTRVTVTLIVDGDTVKLAD